MSQENVEIVRAGIEAWNAGDRDRAMSVFDPELEFHSATERKTYHGLDGMVRYTEDVGAVIADFHFEDTRLLDAGGDRVLGLYRIVGRGAGSGVPVSREVGALFQPRNGKVLKGEIYLDQREALKAAGLRE
jgi:ketosteroid isomerase-like protein